MKPFLPASGVHAALMAAALIWALGCTKPPAPANVLAHVGNRDITVADFKAEWERRVANRQSLPDRSALLAQMIEREALVQQAKAAGLAEAADVRRASEDILIAKLKEMQWTPKIEAAKVTPAEVRATYEKEMARFTQPAKAQLAFIFIAAEAKAPTNQVAVAETRVTEAHRRGDGLAGREPWVCAVGGGLFGRSSDSLSRGRRRVVHGGNFGWSLAPGSGGHWFGDEE